jgi:hypothetical protein
MPLALFMMLQADTTFVPPSYFGPVVVTMLALGAVGWLIAAVLGFARASAFGASARWFSYVSLCLLLFHLQFLALAFGLFLKDATTVFALLTFFNGFVVLGAVCAIMGFVRMTSPR